MQAQVPSDPYVACWSRLHAFEPDELGRQLLERRLVRMTLLRATLHLVTDVDALQMRQLLQEMLERAFASSPFSRTLGDLDLAPVQARAIELLERTPLTLAQLRSELAKEWPERDANALAYAVRYLVPLVQVTPRGVWGRRMQPTVTTLARWLGAEPAPRQGGSDELVLRYLRAFGPATVGDIRTWSWLSDLGSVVDRMRPELSVYRDETGRELFDVRDGAFADRAVTAPVRFLPQFDNVFLSHADRSRIMDAVRWDASFTHRGSFLADGFLAGSWKLAESSRREATLTLDVRARVPSAERRLIREEAEALLLFLTPRAKSRRVVVERR